MENKIKISQLPVETTLKENALLPIVQDNGTKAIKSKDFLKEINTNISALEKRTNEQINASNSSMLSKLDEKLDSNVMDGILVYPDSHGFRSNTRIAPVFKYNKIFSWIQAPIVTGTPHSVVVIDVSQYANQNIDLSCDYVYKENDVLVQRSQIIITTAVDKTVSSYQNNNGGPQWFRLDGVYPNMIDGYCKYSKTHAIRSDRPYIRLAFMHDGKAPTSISLSFNVKINGQEVTPVAFGGFFENDQVEVTDINNNPIIPPAVEDTTSIAIDGTKVLLPDGYALNKYLNYLKELIDNIDDNSSNANNVNMLSNKVWAIMGDSISNQGMYAKTHYYKHIADRNPGLVYNASQGISGTRIAKKNESDTSAMCHRYKNLIANANIVTIFGGVNDWGQQNPTPLGKFEDETEVNSFYGALHSLCKNLIQKYPHTSIIAFP